MDTDNKLIREEFETTGRVWFRNALSSTDLTLLDDLLRTNQRQNERLKLTGGVGQFLASSENLQCCLDILRPISQPVRAVLFNKSSDRNWSIGWHQDRVISVDVKFDVAGFQNWTKKSGVWHCEPPLSLLNEMLFVRIHLDDCDDENGPMEIVRGSHKRGIIPSSDCCEGIEAETVEVCDAKAGDILVLKMLTLHRSRSSSNQKSRRVIRADYSAQKLPLPLQWSG